MYTILTFINVVSECYTYIYYAFLLIAAMCIINKCFMKNFFLSLHDYHKCIMITLLTALKKFFSMHLLQPINFNQIKIYYYNNYWT